MWRWAFAFWLGVSAWILEVRADMPASLTADQIIGVCKGGERNYWGVSLIPGTTKVRLFVATVPDVTDESQILCFVPPDRKIIIEVQEWPM